MTPEQIGAIFGGLTLLVGGLAAAYAKILHTLSDLKSVTQQTHSAVNSRYDALERRLNDALVTILDQDAQLKKKA